MLCDWLIDARAANNSTAPSRARSRAPRHARHVSVKVMFGGSDGESETGLESLSR